MHLKVPFLKPQQVRLLGELVPPDSMLSSCLLSFCSLHEEVEQEMKSSAVGTMQNREHCHREKKRETENESAQLFISFMLITTAR